MGSRNQTQVLKLSPPHIPKTTFKVSSANSQATSCMPLLSLLSHNQSTMAKWPWLTSMQPGILFNHNPSTIPVDPGKWNPNHLFLRSGKTRPMHRPQPGLVSVWRANLEQESPFAPLKSDLLWLFLASGFSSEKFTSKVLTRGKKFWRAEQKRCPLARSRQVLCVEPP